MVVIAGDSDPMAGGGVRHGPGGEGESWVGGNGGFEGEEREAIGVERRRETGEECKEPNQNQSNRVHGFQNVESLDSDHCHCNNELQRERE